jgi:hypothetical protein
MSYNDTQAIRGGPTCKQEESLKSDPCDQERCIEKEFWLADVATYRKLETWGASLFFIAIGVLTKQLMEWTNSNDVTKTVKLPEHSFAAPAILGIAAFVYLRIVNLRVRVAQQKVYELGRIPRLSQWRVGCLGWMLAVIPLGAGYCGSWALALGNFWQMFFPTVVGALVAIAAVICHFRFSPYK